MRLFKCAQLALTLTGLACSDVTAPSTAPATIVFRLAANCPANTYHLFVDGQLVAEPELAPLDSAKFEVSPGTHTAGAVVLEEFVANIWYPQTVTLAAGQRYVQTLGCVSR